MANADLLDLQRRKIAAIIATGLQFDPDIGIGTATPGSYLSGTSGLAIYNSATPGLGFGNASGYWTQYMTGTDLRFYAGGADRFYFTAAGDFYSQTDIRVGGGIFAGGIATDPVISTINTGYQFTLTGGLSDEFYCGLQESPSFTGAFTIARHNYITLNQPALAGGAAVTDGCVFRFNANIATHKALDAGSTHPHMNIPEGWMKINVNAVVYYIPIYSHKT